MESRNGNGFSPGSVALEVDPAKVFSVRDGIISCDGFEVKPNTRLEDRVALKVAIQIVEQKIRSDRPDVDGRTASPCIVGVVAPVKGARELRDGFKCCKFTVPPGMDVYRVAKILDDLVRAKATLAEMSLPLASPRAPDSSVLR